MDTGSLPTEFQEPCQNIDQALTLIESFYNDDGTLKNTGKDILPQITDEFKNSAIKSLINAQTQVTSMYTVNTLLWILFKINGINPLECRDGEGNTERAGGLVDEVKIVQKVMADVTAGERLVKSMRVDKEAAKRIIKHYADVPKEGSN